jgi:hypothetical protein
VGVDQSGVTRIGRRTDLVKWEARDLNFVHARQVVIC